MSGSLAARFVILWLHLVQHKSSLEVLMDLSFDFLLLASPLQFHEDVKFRKVLNNLCLCANDFKKFIWEKGVRPLLD